MPLFAKFGAEKVFSGWSITNLIWNPKIIATEFRERYVIIPDYRRITENNCKRQITTLSWKACEKLYNHLSALTFDRVYDYDSVCLFALLFRSCSSASNSFARYYALLTFHPSRVWWVFSVSIKPIGATWCEIPSTTCATFLMWWSKNTQN